jgi:hypothetical protein
MLNSKSSHPAEDSKIKQNTSPDTASHTREIDNDYGVNSYYAKYKVKTSNKKEVGDVM